LNLNAIADFEYSGDVGPPSPMIQIRQLSTLRDLVGEYSAAPALLRFNDIAHGSPVPFTAVEG